MNLKTLLETKRDLELCMNIYGATAEVKHSYRTFIRALTAHYLPLQQDNQLQAAVLNADVKPEVMRTFKPIYDIFVPYMRDFIGKELPPL